MGRRHRRIGRDIVVGMPEEVRHVEHEPGGISAGCERANVVLSRSEVPSENRDVEQLHVSGAATKTSISQ